MAQVPVETEKTEGVQERVEDVVEASEDDVDLTEILEELNIYLKHKLNLNRATNYDLQKFFFLNEIQIQNLQEHIRVNGPLLAVYELQTIECFGSESIQKLLPYVYVSGDITTRTLRFSELLRDGQNQIFVRYQQNLEEQKGYSPIDDSSYAANPNSRYLGSPFRLYTRYRYTYYNNISFGITAEKDPGEEFFKGTQKQGYDFYSAHFYMRNVGKIHSLAIGDYHLQFGQGLNLWSGFGFGKSFDAINIKKNALGIRPYTSVDENLFMRGAAGTFAFKNFEFTGFFSKKKRDAGILSPADTLDNEEDQLLVSSLLETGFHRTPSEIDKKRTIDEIIYGGNITYRQRRFNIGITAHKTQLSAKLDRQLYLYNQFDFNEKENFNIGIDYNYIFRNINFFGEVARSQNSGMAMVNGAIISLDPKLSLSILHRKYDKNYQALYSNAFSEGSSIANEEGIFLGLMFKPKREFTFWAYADNFSSNWLKYRVDAPSRGFDYLIQANYSPSRQLEIYARYRNKTKQLNNSDDSNMIDFLDDTEKENLRFDVRFNASPEFLIKSRIEHVTYSVGEDEYKGYALYQDFRYAPQKLPIVLTLRYALFDTDNYDTRLYVYENDVLYASSFPSYYYKGSRAYILLRYRVMRNLDFWIRFAQTYYTDRFIIGSGMDEIQGNKKSEIKAQIRFKF
ncbi:MAG: helix-hairpin-helix domain-containing protein [Bacteroidales bacterium]|nr:helix-hairpin-helix domain-containing protein [Bacteroidales bacterium]